MKLLNGERSLFAGQILYPVSGLIQGKMTGGNRLFKETREKYQ